MELESIQELAEQRVQKKSLNMMSAINQTYSSNHIHEMLEPKRVLQHF